MTIAANLQQAAGLAYDNMFVKWQLGVQLRLRCQGFLTHLDPFFPDNIPDNRPVGNWFVPFTALANSMPAGKASLEQFNACVQFMYRVCWATDAARTALLISSAQATEVLNEYNSRFG